MGNKYKNMLSEIDSFAEFNLKREAPAPVIYQDEMEEEESSGGMLPIGIVFPVMVAASVWKAMVISLVGIAWQFIIWAYILIDKVYDTTVRLFIGTICKPCAWLAIWAFKLPTMPIVLFGYGFRIMIESMGALVSGWMLFFGGSGCYLRWGHNCWFAKRFKNRSYWEIADLTIWMRSPADFFVKSPELSFSDSIHQFFAVPRIEDFDTEVARLMGEERRQRYADSCPINRKNVKAAKNASVAAMEYFSL